MQQQIRKILKYSSTAIMGVALFGLSTAASLNACPAPQGAKVNMGALHVRSLAAIAKLAGPRPAAEPSAPADVDPNGAIVGMWHVTASIDGQVADEAFEQFFSDGNELMIDTTPPAQDNVCNGVWVQGGTLLYKVKHPSFVFDNNGNLIGTAMIRSAITLDRAALTFTGTQTVDIFDNAGNMVDQIQGIVLKGTRIKPD